MLVLGDIFASSLIKGFGAHEKVVWPEMIIKSYWCVQVMCKNPKTQYRGSQKRPQHMDLCLSYMWLYMSFMWSIWELMQSDCSIMPRAPITKEMVILVYLMEN